MAGQVVAFRSPATIEAGQALRAGVDDLHALISLDPVLGASPLRVYFVSHPQGKTLIEASPGGHGPRAAAYALVAYDFAFALRLLAYAGAPIPPERARRIISRSAGLHGETLRRAAEALGVDADPVPAFDAAALKTAFFPNTQETLTHVFRLELQ